MTDPTRIAPLMTPLTIRGLTVPNRFVMAPMTREKSPGGIPGGDVAGYYQRRAERHVGLIITEGTGIAHDAAVDSPTVPVLHGDAALAGWKTVVDAVHAAGGRIFPQLWHQGAMRDSAISPRPDVPSYRPSATWGIEGKVSLAEEKVARLRVETAPMSDSDIADIIAAYATSARHARDLGFDGVAIHAAHGYLPDNFLWHGTNRRTDRWGGDHKGRATFVVEMVKAIRAEIGEALPILLRISQFKMQDYKARLADTPAELEALLGPIADAGVDIFDGSQRYFDTPVFAGSPLNLGGWAKKLTGKLGMAVGGVGLDKGERDHHVDSGSATVDNLGKLLARFDRGEFDLIGVGRSLLNDPDWLGKMIRGEEALPFDNGNLARLT